MDIPTPLLGVERASLPGCIRAPSLSGWCVLSGSVLSGNWESFCREARLFQRCLNPRWLDTVGVIVDQHLTLGNVHFHHVNARHLSQALLDHGST